MNGTRTPTLGLSVASRVGPSPRNLVLGSEGFVGKPFCAYLESQGETVARFDIKRGDAEDGRNVAVDLNNIDCVYFLAWDVGGAKYIYRDDIQLWQLDWNLKLLLNIMPQLQAAEIPFLFVSSQLAQEYDTVYGVTKRLGEVWTNLLNGVRVRLWNVYGPLEEPSERSHVVADFVYQALTSGEIRMLTSGTEQRQFVHISDVCRAFRGAMQQRLHGIYDVTSFEWTTVRHLADAIAELTGATVTPGERGGSTPITPIVGKIPGWLPQVSLEDGLRMMTEQMRKQLASAT
jgi:nucleoside-diphosphate-sugar epimerase